MSIKIKSKLLQKSPTDISNIINRYKLGDVVFDSLFNEFLIDNFTTLYNNSRVIGFDNKYEYRPDYVSYDYYQTTNLWFMILYVNGIQTIIDFNKDNLDSIVVPEKNIVNKLINKWRRNYLVNKDEPIDLEKIVRGAER